jgi:hypothetical protein
MAWSSRSRAIDSATGVLTPVPGSPFATGGLNVNQGIALAVTPDGQFLYAGTTGANNISAFSIGSNGALTPVAGSPFPLTGFPFNMKVTPDRKFLAMAQSSGLAMFSIGSNGALTTVPGSPFSLFGVGLDVNCASNLLFACNNTSTSQGIVNVLETLPLNLNGDPAMGVKAPLEAMSIPLDRTMELLTVSAASVCVTSSSARASQGEDSGGHLVHAHFQRRHPGEYQLAHLRPHRQRGQPGLMRCRRKRHFRVRRGFASGFLNRRKDKAIHHLAGKLVGGQVLCDKFADRFQPAVLGSNVEMGRGTRPSERLRLDTPECNRPTLDGGHCCEKERRSLGDLLCSCFMEGRSCWAP